MSLVLDQASRHATNLSWDGSCNFRFTQTKDYFPNPEKGGGTSSQLSLAENRTPSSLTMLYQDSSRLSPSKGTASQVLNRGLLCIMLHDLQLSYYSVLLSMLQSLLMPI